IDARRGTAEYGIVIGEKDAWGKGYGTEATRLMLAYGFDVLGLQNIMLRVYANNPAGVRAYERAGFRKVGVLRNAMPLGRVRVDEILMDAIPDDIPPSDLQRLMVEGPQPSEGWGHEQNRSGGARLNPVLVDVPLARWRQAPPLRSRPVRVVGAYIECG